MSDTFASPVEVSIATPGGTYTSSGVSNVGYGTEAGEPTNIYGDPANRSAWWIYRPASPGKAVIDTELGTPDDTVLEVFTGETLTTLIRVAGDDESGTGSTSKITYIVASGHNYYIRVSGYLDEDLTYILRVVGPDTMDTDDVGPIDAVATPPPNDDIPTAYPVYIHSHNDIYLSGPVENYNYTGGSADWPLEDAFGYRTAWWSYTPDYSGQATVDNYLGRLHSQTIRPSVIVASAALPAKVPHFIQPAAIAASAALPASTITADTVAVTVVPDPIASTATLPASTASTPAESTYLSIFTEDLVNGNPNFYDLDQIEGFFAGVAQQITWDVEAGRTYYICISRPVDADLIYALRVQGPRAIGSLPTEVLTEPIEILAEVPAAGLIWVSLVPVFPASGYGFQSLRPVFKVQLSAETAGAAVTVEVQWSTSSSFTSPTTVSQDVNMVGTVANVLLVAPSNLSAGTQYYWRARWLVDSFASDWVYQDDNVGDSWFETVGLETFTESVGWTVNTTVVREPHLWAVIPARGVPGDTVRLYGHGFSDSTGTVTVAGTSATIGSWTHIAATGNALTSSRVINPGVLIDAEHDEVVITVPSVAPPGGPLVVE